MRRLINLSGIFRNRKNPKPKNPDLAILNLKKALELDPKNKNAEEMLKRIGNN